MIFQESVNVERLDIGGNWIMPEGGRAISKLLEENEYITEMVRTATFCHCILTYVIFDFILWLFLFSPSSSAHSFFSCTDMSCPENNVAFFFIVYHEIR